MKIEGSVALVTGAARRIGRAISYALAENGASVAVHYFTSEEDAKVTVEGVHNLGANADMFSANLENPQETKALIDNVTKRFGYVNILINNASIFEISRLRNLKIDDWDRHMNINARAPFILAQSMWQSLSLKDEAQGKIINIGDWRGIRPNRVFYGISKQTLSALTRSLALYMAPNVQVNEVALGAILPPVKPSNKANAANSPGPAKRKGTLNEVTSAVLALIDNDFITGQILTLDGGDHIR